VGAEARVGVNDPPARPQPRRLGGVRTYFAVTPPPLPRPPRSRVAGSPLALVLAGIVAGPCIAPRDVASRVRVIVRGPSCSRWSPAAQVTAPLFYFKDLGCLAPIAVTWPSWTAISCAARLAAGVWRAIAVAGAWDWPSRSCSTTARSSRRLRVVERLRSRAGLVEAGRFPPRARCRIRPGCRANYQLWTYHLFSRQRIVVDDRFQVFFPSAARPQGGIRARGATDGRRPRTLEGPPIRGERTRVRAIPAKASVPGRTSRSSAGSSR